MESILYTDRSRTLARQKCARRGWFEYDIPNGTPIPGVVLTRLNSDLMIGSAFHTGVESLLTDHSPDESVWRALEGDGGHWPGFWPLVRSKGLVLGDKEDAYYVYHEQASLIEALIRGYAKYALPMLLARFDVVEVEREGNATLVDGDFTLIWGYRADALLLERDTQDLYVLSLKTTKDFSKKKAEGGNRDMQGLSEVAAIDQRLQGWQEATTQCSILQEQEFKQASLEHKLEILKRGNKNPEDVPAWFVSRWEEGAPPSCFGVKMEYALKGLKLEDPKGSGVWKYSNPLIRPWKYAEDLGGKGRRAGLGNERYAISYDFTDDMGGNHRLGKGWVRINIWEDMGVKEWIEYVADTPIQGFDSGRALAAQFALPEEFYRNDNDIERWKKRIVFAGRRQSLGVVSTLDALGTGNFEVFEDRLDEFFPPSSDQCDYPTRCVYQDICYSANKGYLFNPMSAGIYEPRTPNHTAELVTIKGTIEAAKEKA